MSRTPTFPSSSQKPQTWSWKVPSFSVSQPSVTPSSSSLKRVTSTDAGRPSPSPIPSGSNGQARALSKPPAALEVEERAKRRRILTHEEEEIKRRISSSIALSLEADRIQVLYPDVDKPFEDEFDAVNRLLPYHILQQPKEDLDAIINPKGKSKAVEEIQDTKLSIECHKRLVKLQERFRNARIASGKHPSPTPQAICLERLALESDRHETSNIDQALSAARSELDKLQRANILATMKTSKPATTTQTPAASSAPAYSYQNHTFSVSPAPTYNQFYNSYTYSYGQNGSTPYSANSSVPAFSVQNPTASSAPAAKTQFSAPVRQPAAGSSISPPASVAIPLQVPVTLLPSLQAIGILPVPKASLPPPSEPQPAAVLIGTTNNGTMLSLEINAALLQGPQMSGLAVLLSDLVKTSGNNNPPANGTQGNS